MCPSAIEETERNFANHALAYPELNAEQLIKFAGQDCQKEFAALSLAMENNQVENACKHLFVWIEIVEFLIEDRLSLLPLIEDLRLFLQDTNVRQAIRIWKTSSNDGISLSHRLHRIKAQLIFQSSHDRGAEILRAAYQAARVEFVIEPPEGTVYHSENSSSNTSSGN